MTTSHKVSFIALASEAFKTTHDSLQHSSTSPLLMASRTDNEVSDFRVISYWACQTEDRPAGDLSRPYQLLKELVRILDGTSAPIVRAGSLHADALEDPFKSRPKNCWGCQAVKPYSNPSTLPPEMCSCHRQKRCASRWASEKRRLSGGGGMQSSTGLDHRIGIVWGPQLTLNKLIDM